VKPDASGGAQVGEAGCPAGTKPGRALELAYRYLNRRDRTVAEVRKHLINREIEPGEAEAAIERLLENHVLDDARFARMFVDDKRTLEQSTVS